jgi:uncharacterized SAM-binding protein YcdF (DUF218 family)
MAVTSPSNPRRTKQRIGLRLAVCVGLLALLVWGVGFTRFVGAIPRAEPATEVRADAIVVLTGGAQRLGAGFRLLREGRGDHLFVSGVNEDVRPGDLHALAVLHQTAEPIDAPKCCVELGFQALDTRGNADEIAAWAREKGLSSLIMVTSNYPMPRAFRELRAALPGIRIHRHPVVARTVMLNAWWRWPGSLALLAGEYQKLLLTGIRLFFQGKA